MKIYMLSEPDLMRPLLSRSLHLSMLAKNLAALNLTPSLLHALTRLLTSKVLVNVTIGIGELIQSSNASALFVSLGFTSVFI